MLQILIVFMIILLLISIALCIFSFSLSLSFLFGAPFLTTPNKIVKKIIKISELSPSDILIDLGSGDGRLIIEAAKICKKAVGYEINPFLVLYSKIAIILNGINKNTEVYFQNYLHGDMRYATVVTLYGIRSHIPRIENKLKKELKKGTKIISYKFELSGFNHIKTIDSNIFLYDVI